jgi:uncharacterized membrane protein YesL
MASFNVLWLAIKDLFDELFSLIVVNLFWVVLSAPLLLVALYLVGTGATVLGIAVGLLAVLPMAPSTAGLYTVAQRIAEGRVISWRLFFKGFRDYLLLSWRVYGLWAGGLALILSNMRFYSTLNSILPLLLLGLFMSILIIWLGIFIYIGPLMVLQADKRLRLIARNAILMVMVRPVFTLLTGLFMLLLGLGLGVLTGGLLPILVTFSFLAIWSFRATSRVIADDEARRTARQEQDAASNRINTDKGRGGQVRPPD